MILGSSQPEDYHIYYPDIRGRIHFVSDGESVCKFGVQVPEVDQLKSAGELSTEDWSSLLDDDSNLCSDCEKKVRGANIIPDEFAVESSGNIFEFEYPDDEVRPPVSGYHIYYRKATQLQESPRDHIVDGGEALCNYGVVVGFAQSLKPFENVSKEEWSLLLGNSSNLCRYCYDVALSMGILPENIPEEEPEYECPECSEPAEKVNMSDVASVYHSSTFKPEATIHETPRKQYEEWRRNPA